MEIKNSFFKYSDIIIKFLIIFSLSWMAVVLLHIEINNYKLLDIQSEIKENNTLLFKVLSENNKILKNQSNHQVLIDGMSNIINILTNVQNSTNILKK